MPRASHTNFFSHCNAVSALFSRNVICLAVCVLATPLSIPIAHAAESDNTINITANHAGDVIGGGHISYTGDATRNTVNMLNGIVSGNTYGGYSASGSATHNTRRYSG